MKRKLKLIMDLPSKLWMMFVTYCPGEIGFIFRRRFWRKQLGYLGKDVLIDVGVYFENPSYISIDDNTWIDRNVVILAGMDTSTREKIVIKNSRYPGTPGMVQIGKNCHIGIGSILSGISAGLYISDNCGMAAYNKIYAFSHHYQSRENPEKQVIACPMAPDDSQCLIEGPVFIGTNVAIGLNCTILPGVILGNDIGVHINSVVHLGRYKNGVRISGDPAKKVGFRYKIMEDEFRKSLKADGLSG